MKIGFISAGSMAARMAKTVSAADGFELYAVAARDETRAKAFAEEYGFEKSYAGYDALLNDGNVDLVYISTVNTEHFRCAKAALEKGFPVLLEKPFTINAKETKELLDLAKENNVFLCEAMWTRFLPMLGTLRDILDRGVIGDAGIFTADFSTSMQRDRYFNPAIGGGALLDLGVYLISLALFVFGDDIANVTSAAALTENGVDARETVILSYRDGRIASFNASNCAHSGNQASIFGSKGYIVVDGVTNPSSITVYGETGEEIERHACPEQISGYEYQLEAAAKAIAGGRIECDEMPHSLTLRIMELMDGIRADWGLKYPSEIRQEEPAEPDKEEPSADAVSLDGTENPDEADQDEKTEEAEQTGEPEKEISGKDGDKTESPATKPE